MAAVHNNLYPRANFAPKRTIKYGGKPESTETETITWQFHRLDMEHKLWGWNKLNADDLNEILSALKSFEGLTWAKLKEQAGGKKNGTNHHSIYMDDFSKEAKTRISDLHLEEYDELFSLRIKNTTRLYGIRDGRALKLVWHDPHHFQGSPKAAYLIPK